MVNEGIVTALKNAVERGESLESASDIMIISGFSQEEVREASGFVGFVPVQKLNFQEQFVMPEQKSFSSKAFKKNQVSLNQTPLIKPSVQQLPQRIQTSLQIKNEISSQPSQYLPKPYPQQIYSQQIPYPLSEQSSKTVLKKQNYAKEIILLIILLILIGALISTFIFKDAILGFFS